MYERYAYRLLYFIEPDVNQLKGVLQMNWKKHIKNLLVFIFTLLAVILGCLLYTSDAADDFRWFFYL